MTFITAIKVIAILVMVAGIFLFAVRHAEKHRQKIRKYKTSQEFLSLYRTNLFRQNGRNIYENVY